MPAWKLTVRHGSKVAHEEFDDLRSAIEEMKRRAEAIRSEEPLKKVSVPREYEPSEQVHARLEVSMGGLLRRREAGIDVMGDGSLIPYRGAVRRVPLDGGDPFDAVAAALDGGAR